MLKDIKLKLLENPHSLSNILEYFGFCNIAIRAEYMQFGRDEYGSRKSIVINLKNNDYLYVKDYPQNINCELISYIMKQKNVSFIEVLNAIKKELNIESFYQYEKDVGIFGGFYNKIKKRTSFDVITYDNSILYQYSKNGNIRFLKDRISLEAQNFFNIHYDAETQGIVIPIYNQFFQIIGIKIRVNKDVEDGEQKYFYLVPCPMSQTLYGYCHNYEHLVENTIYIFESEKSIMQCYSYGIRNCVAIGSSSISKKQIQLLLELQPKSLIFMHDEGLEFERINTNIKLVQAYGKFSECKIGHWDTTIDGTIPSKASASDLGKSKLMEILNTQIKYVVKE